MMPVRKVVPAPRSSRPPRASRTEVAGNSAFGLRGRPLKSARREVTALMVSIRRLTATAFTALVTLGIASVSHGALFEFDLVPASSFLTVTGTISGTIGQNLTAQSTGSNKATYSGPLFVDLTGSTIQLTGGSTLTAANQATAQQPAVGGGTGSAPANYGLSTSGLATGNVAVRDLAADLTTDPIPLSGGTFDSTAVTLTTLAGTIDYRLSVFLSGTQSGTSVANPYSSLNTSSTLSTIVDVGAIETLTIPIALTLVIPVPLPGGLPEQANVTLTGQLVATRTLPPIAGDLDGNRVVNLADYTIFKNEWMQHGSGLAADLNSDGVVDLKDFPLFKADYQAFNGGGGTDFLPPAPVPEPATAALAFLAAAFVAVPVWRRRKCSAHA